MNGSNTTTKLLKCAFCAKKFATRAARKTHTATVHGTSQPGPASVPRASAASRRPPANGRNHANLTAAELRTGSSMDFIRRIWPGVQGDQLGKTAQGQSFALQALHPCNSSHLEPEGIPDETNTETVTASRRAAFTISKPTAVGNVEAWDFIVLTPPIPGLAFIWAKGPAGTDFRSTWDNDANIEWGVEYEPGYSAAYAGEIAATRTAAKGITIYFVGSSLYDQGVSYSWQGNRVPDRQEVDDADGAGAIDTNFVMNVPVDESDFIQLSKVTVQLAAKHGVYMPLQFRDPVHLWQRPVFNNGSFSMNTVNGSNFNTEIFNLGRTTTPIKLTDNMLTGVSLFRGVDGRATFSVKYRRNEETQPGTNSAVAPFVKASPLQDQRALKMVVHVQHTLNYAYPSDHNSFGKILSKIIHGINYVSSKFTDLPGPWGLGARIISGVSGAASQFI